MKFFFSFFLPLRHFYFYSWSVVTYFLIIGVSKTAFCEKIFYGISFFFLLFYFIFFSVVLFSPSCSSSSSYHILLASTNFTVRYNVYFPASSGWSLEKIIAGLDLISTNHVLSNAISRALPALGVIAVNIPIGAYDST